MASALAGGGHPVSRELLAVGLNHRSAPLTVRERVAVSRDELPRALRVLHEHLPEGILLSTCNRMEVYTVAASLQGGKEGIGGFLRQYFDVPPRELAPCLYVLRQSAAARHLFRVSSGLDSMVLGEAEILGQVKEALQQAQLAGTAGKVTNRSFIQAIHTGKRARTETGIGAGALSVSSVAVAQARKLLGDLSACSTLVISAGEMGWLAAKILGRWGGRLMIASRTYERAAEVAERLGGQPVPLPQLPQALVEADIVLSATGSKGYVLTFDMVQAAVAQRQGRPLLLIDIAVPRDVEPRVAELPGVHVFNIDDLEAVAAANLYSREQEVARVEAIVEDEVESFLRWHSGLSSFSNDPRRSVAGARQEAVARPGR